MTYLHLIKDKSLTYLYLIKDKSLNYHQQLKISHYHFALISRKIGEILREIRAKVQQKAMANRWQIALIVDLSETYHRSPLL